MNYFPIVNRHAAWIVVNPIQGCVNGCKYCFLQSKDGIRTQPEVLVSPQEAINQLSESPYYINDIPVCFFSQTDIFATENNIEYLSKILDIWNSKDMKNPMVLITKCHIPLRIIEKFIKLRQHGKTILIYLSYSGLGNSIEPGINPKDIRDNFINLKRANIPIIHYFRPIVPQNSSYEVLREIISFVSNYSVASVVAGLKIEQGFQQKLDFWPEIMFDDRVLKVECVWPKGAREKIHKIALEYNYPVYDVNSCALSLALQTAERYGFYNSNSCISFNCCPIANRSICKDLYNKKDFSCLESKLHSLLIKLGISDTYKFSIEKDVLLLSGISLTTEDTCFLSGELHMRVDCLEKKVGSYWNTSINRKEGVAK